MLPTPVLTPPLVACITPFHNAKPDLAAFQNSLHFLATKGCQAIVVNGTTGEFAGMSSQDRLATIRLASETFAGYIVNNISSCSTSDSIALARASKAFTHAFLLLPPFYFKRPNTCHHKWHQGCKVFFQTILQECQTMNKSCFLYNFPFHTGNTIPPSLYAELCEEFPTTILGIKDSSGDLTLSLAYKAAAPLLKVYVGNDDRALDTLHKGLDGSVTGAASPVVELMVGIQDNFLRNKFKECEMLQLAVQKWGTLRKDCQSDICVAKIAFALRGVSMKPDCLPPLVGIEVLEEESLVKQLKEFINMDLLKYKDMCVRNGMISSATPATTSGIKDAKCSFKPSCKNAKP